MSNHFEMMDEDHCVYVKRLNDKFVILTLYVDAILLAENNKKYLLTIKEWLSFNFQMKDMGEASYILGVKDSSKSFKKIINSFPRTVYPEGA